MTEHNHTTIVAGCYRCDLNKDEVIDSAVDTVKEALREHVGDGDGADQAILDIYNRAMISAALDAAKLRQIASDVLKPYDPDLPDYLAEEIASDIRRKILGQERTPDGTV